MSYTDALARVAQINTEMLGMQSAFALPATSGSTSTPTASTTGASTTFSSALDSAMSSSALSTLSGSALGAAAGTTANGGVALGTAALPANAAGMLTSNQQAFASRLAADTGLDPGVVSAWLLAEESGGAATSRQSAGNNDWLNIGYTDAGTYGSGDSVWSDPIGAADATAGWLQGHNTIPGYGTASSGIEAILATAGQAPAAQISAIQGSGWASSGYPDLPGLYTQVTA